jgi:PadR family transcriptional regulator PadR
MRFFGNSWPVVGEFELLVLLALVRLGNGAFGAAIHREIVAKTDRELPASAVYVTLERLEAKRMVCSYLGNPTNQRGGRRRKHYLLDTAGQRALVRAYRTFNAMTTGIQQELEALAAQMLPGASAAKPSSHRARW